MIAEDDSRIPLADTISLVENPESLFRRARQASLLKQRTERGYLRAEELAHSPKETETRLNMFHDVADLVVSEGRSVPMVPAPVTRLTCDQILDRDAVASVPVHVEEALLRFLTNSSVTDGPTGANCASALLERLFVPTADNVLLVAGSHWPDYRSRTR